MALVGLLPVPSGYFLSLVSYLGSGLWLLRPGKMTYGSGGLLISSPSAA